MKRAFVFTIASMIALSATAMGAEPVSFGELSSADAVFAPNPEYDKYNVFSYEFASETSIVTCSTNEEESEFYFNYSFYGDEQATICDAEGNISFDKSGFMAGDTPGILSTAKKVGSWAPIDKEALAQAAEEEEEAEEELPYIFEELTCQRDDLTIRGHYLLPLDYTEGKLPTIIFTHGYNTNHMQVPINYAEKIVNEGYACILFDFCGGSGASTSDGDGTQMSIFTEEEDLKCVFAQTLEYDFVDPDQVFLLGISQGGVIAALAAADLADQVKAMVLCFPAFTLVDDARATYASIEDVPETVELMGFTIGHFFYENLLDFEVLPAVSSYEGDVLILHGTEDALVPYESSEKAVEAYAHAELIPIEGANHGFRGEHLEAAMGPITEFIKAHTEG